MCTVLVVLFDHTSVHGKKKALQYNTITLTILVGSTVCVCVCVCIVVSYDIQTWGKEITWETQE